MSTIPDPPDATAQTGYFGSPLTTPLLLACVLLLGYSSTVQTMLLVRSSRSTFPDAPLEVVVTEPVEIDAGPSGLPVAIESAGYAVTLPVSIQDAPTLSVDIENVSTSDELKVNLQNHYIIGSDPIPVEISR